jgi:hypothetical protein
MKRAKSQSDSEGFEDDETVETVKKSLIAEIEAHSLERSVRNLVPVDLMAIFELKSAEATIDRNAELRREVVSFVEIAFESRIVSKMYINFPKHNLANLCRLLKPFNDINSLKTEKNLIIEAARLEPSLSMVLKPIFEEEAIFYE